MSTKSWVRPIHVHLCSSSRSGLADQSARLQAPRVRLSHLLSVQARNLPVQHAGLGEASAYFVLWAHLQPDQSQALTCAYISEQV